MEFKEKKDNIYNDFKDKVNKLVKKPGSFKEMLE